MKCCWNEDDNVWYDVISLGSNKYQCLGCYNKLEKKQDIKARKSAMEW